MNTGLIQALEQQGDNGISIKHSLHTPNTPLTVADIQMYPLNNTFSPSIPNYFANYERYTTETNPHLQLWRAYEIFHNVVSIFNRGDDLCKAFSVLGGLRNYLVLLALQGADMTYSQLTKHPLENSKYLQMTHYCFLQPPSCCILSNGGN